MGVVGNGYLARVQDLSKSLHSVETANDRTLKSETCVTKIEGLIAEFKEAKLNGDTLTAFQERREDFEFECKLNVVRLKSHLGECAKSLATSLDMGRRVQGDLESDLREQGGMVFDREGGITTKGATCDVATNTNPLPPSPPPPAPPIHSPPQTMSRKSSRLLYGGILQPEKEDQTLRSSLEGSDVCTCGIDGDHKSCPARHHLSKRIIDEVFDDNRQNLKKRLSEALSQLEAFQSGEVYDKLNSQNRELNEVVEQLRNELGKAMMERADSLLKSKQARTSSVEEVRRLHQEMDGLRDKVTALTAQAMEHALLATPGEVAKFEERIGQLEGDRSELEQEVESLRAAIKYHSRSLQDSCKSTAASHLSNSKGVLSRSNTPPPSGRTPSDLPAIHSGSDGGEVSVIVPPLPLSFIGDGKGESKQPTEEGQWADAVGDAIGESTASAQPKSAKGRGGRGATMTNPPKKQGNARNRSKTVPTKPQQGAKHPQTARVPGGKQSALETSTPDKDEAQQDADEAKEGEEGGEDHPVLSDCRGEVMRTLNQLVQHFLSRENARSVVTSDLRRQLQDVRRKLVDAENAVVELARERGKPEPISAEGKSSIRKVILCARMSPRFRAARRRSHSGALDRLDQELSEEAAGDPGGGSPVESQCSLPPITGHAAGAG